MTTNKWEMLKHKADDGEDAAYTLWRTGVHGGVVIEAGLSDADARLIERAPRLLELLATMTGAAELDGLDQTSNVWRSAMLDANALLKEIDNG